MGDQLAEQTNQEKKRIEDNFPTNFYLFIQVTIFQLIFL